MDAKNMKRIEHVINTLSAVTTKDRETARWMIDIIDQLKEIVAIDDVSRIEEWRKRLELEQ